MSSFSNPSGLYSHPNKLLEQHLLNVANTAREIMESSLSTSVLGLNKETLVNLAYIIGLTHDFGKATSFFQDHLFNGRKGKETHHSPLSSLFSFKIASYYLDVNTIEPQIKTFLQAEALLLVKDHHADLDNFVAQLMPFGCEVKEQIDSIDEEKLTKLLSNIKIEEYYPQPITKNILQNWLEQFQAVDVRRVRVLLSTRFPKIDTPELYLLNNLLFSTLINADKVDAAIGEEPSRKAFFVEDSYIRSYKENLPKKKLNHLRDETFMKATDEFNKILRHGFDKHMFFLTLPTGIGKTLISFAIANELKENLQETTRMNYRIIYSVPFINIIEQNAATFRDLFSLKYGNMVTSDMLLLNHHLGDIYFCTSEENYDSDKSRILIESWESEFIVTTFVQLFHTLLSNRNSMLIKFNKLAKSIFIIDEIQGLPLKYWKLISQLLDETLRMFDSYAIIMTATKPLYFDETKGIELINFDWSQLDRYIVDAKTYAHTQDMKSFIDIFPVESDKTYLFVLNTVKEATDFYNFLKEKIPKQQKKIGFLSTHVTPEERIQRINGVKNGAIKYLVSTQIVEAGVDIDFDVVVRDMAPLDSIIQSAGRCNRSGEHYTGQVYVTRFTNAQNKDKTFGSYIYDKTLLEITENLLKDNVFHEKDLESLFKRYESDIQKKKDTEGLSDILYKNVINLNYSGENGITSFQVIDEKFPKIDIFIELNSDAADVFQRYRQIKEIRNIFERKRAFSEIKNQFYKYVISIPSTTQNIPPVDSDFLYVPIDNLTDYYDPDTGFILEGRDAIW